MDKQTSRALFFLAAFGAMLYFHLTPDPLPRIHFYGVKLGWFKVGWAIALPLQPAKEGLTSVSRNSIHSPLRSTP